MRQRIDIQRPKEMEDYLKHYGWHFSKRAAQYAASTMWNLENGEIKYIEPYTREEVLQMLAKEKIELEYDKMYDSTYVANMAKADLMGGENPAIEDDAHLARYIKRVVDDPDAQDGEIFATWVMRQRAKGEPIDWEQML